MAIETDVASHYGNAGIAERIIAALRAVSGADAPVTVDALSVLDHFHGRGVAATKELVEVLKPKSGEHLLDIGSGIGGPARGVAAPLDGPISGVDPDAGFCAAAGAVHLATGVEGPGAVKNGRDLALT